jgi:hypothetical protein
LPWTPPFLILIDNHPAIIAICFFALPGELSLPIDNWINKQVPTGLQQHNIVKMAPVRPISPQDSPMQSDMLDAREEKEDNTKEETVSIDSSDGLQPAHFPIQTPSSSSSPHLLPSPLPQAPPTQAPSLTRISFSLKNRGPSQSASVLPQPQTDSARDARRAFFCMLKDSLSILDDVQYRLTMLIGDLCQKGYARSTDFEAHEGSYDHQHRKVHSLFSCRAQEFLPIFVHSSFPADES